MDIDKTIQQYGISTYVNSTSKIIAFTAIIYFLLAKLSLFIFINEINLPPFFPAIGFGTAAVFIFGRKALLGVGLASLVFSIGLFYPQILHAINQQTFLNALIFSIVRPVTITLNICIVHYLTQLWCKTKYPFNTGKHILYFATACLLGSAIAPTLGAVLLSSTSTFNTNDLVLLWSNFIRGNALGIVLFTPFVISWLSKPENDTKYNVQKKTEILLISLITIILSIYIFETKAHNESALYLLLIWVAYRFDFRHITMITSIIAAIALYYTKLKTGSFGSTGWNNNFFLLQVFLFVNMVSILFFKAILNEKEKEKTKLKISEQDLGLEKTIFKTTIEYSNDISIFSLDTNLNYLSFNSAHENYMKRHHGTTIRIGDNHMALMTWENKKTEFLSIYQYILKGNIYSKEEKDPAGEYWKISKFPIMDKENKIIGVTTIITNITELKLKEIQLEKNNLALNERIKEQECLFDISKTMSSKSLSISEKLKSCALTIPNALQFPEFSNCRIHFREEDYLSANYQKNDCHINQKIIINNKENGFIEIGYFDTESQRKKVVFLEEEIKLLETISDIISESIQTKIAEEKLTESEENYRLLFENVHDVFFQTSVKTKEILEVSPSCNTFNGITREELIGQPMASIYSDSDKAQLMFQKILMEHKIVDYTNEITIKGKSFYVSINAKIIFDSDGEPECVIGSLRDVTKRRMAEKNLKISEEKFRSIYENMQDVYYLHDLKGTILDVSPSIQKHFNLKQENVIGKNVSQFYSIPALYETLSIKIQKKGFLNDQEIEFMTPAGEKLFFSINSKLTHDQNGQLTLVEGTMRNITDRLTNQKKLIEATEQIKQSEEKFRSIFENMEDVYYLHDLEGTILDISPSCEKYFKLKREELIGYTTNVLFNDTEKQLDLRKKLLRDKSINDEYVQFASSTATDEPMHFSVNCKIIYDKNGDPCHVEGSMRNINERINNQNKLIAALEKIKQSEEEFRAIFESFEDLYYRLSLDGLIQNVSPSIQKILKYSQQEIIGTNVAELYLNPEDRKRIINSLNEKGHVTDFESIFKDKNNDCIYVSINSQFVYDCEGNPIYTEGTIRDISQRKRNELEIELANQTIKESELKYRTIFESVRDVFFRASAIDHKIIDISPSCSYFGISPEEIIGKSIEEFYHHSQDRQAVLEEMMKNGEVKNHDVTFELKSKTYHVSINSKISYNQDNKPEFLIGSFRDITDRIHTEEKLKISEAKFRNIYENFEDVYFKTSIPGKILDVSPSFEKHFKKPCSEALKQTVFDFYYDANDREILLQKLNQQSQVNDFDARFKDNEGTVIFFSLNATIRHDENGIPLYIEGTMRNINDRISIQKEMIAKNRQLEFQNTELEQFAYIASHDLQEPLITVIHCIDLLQDELGENLDDDQKQYLEFINSSTSRMQVLVKGLLDYSRIGKERKTSQIDCNEIVKNVLADMAVTLNESNAVIEYKNLPSIVGNTTEMRQLFQNLISNANKFRKKGQQPIIKIAAEKQDTHWLFSVQDNGIGIEEEDIEKAFVIFKRLNNRSDYKGTGIGLSHCKKIIEQHKGKIWVESIPNEGSTFKWTFPIEQNN